MRRPINDIYPVPLPYLSLAVLELVDLRMRGVPTLVHCQAGRSRSPTIIALYWMARDGMDWDSALARVTDVRPIVDPNPFFRNEQSRAIILAEVRRLLAGDVGMLRQARDRRMKLLQQFADRPTDIAHEDDGRNLVADRLAIGGSDASGQSLHEAGVRDVVLVGDIVGEATMSTFPAGESPDVHRLPCDSAADLLRATARIGDLWRRGLQDGRTVCVLSGGDERAGTVALCSTLMSLNERDRATALWYVGSRRATTWQHVREIWSPEQRNQAPRDALG